MFLDRHNQELSILMARAGWGCLFQCLSLLSDISAMPFPAHIHESLCLACTLNSWLGHLFLPSWLWVRSTHSPCQSGPQTTSTASANINNSDNCWYLFKALYAFPNLFPKVLTTSRHSWRSAFWKATLYRLKQNTIMHLFFEEQILYFSHQTCII